MFTSTSKRPSPAQLRALRRSRTLVRVHRAALDAGHVTGRIVGHSTKLIALARIGETRPNGFAVVRRADITEVEAPDPYELHGAGRATRLVLAVLAPVVENIGQRVAGLSRRL